MKKINFYLVCFCLCLAWLPVVSAKQALPLSIMTFNIENGGTQIDFNKVVEAIKKSGADVVGIQEAWGNTERLAKALGWRYFDNSQHIISRLPLLVTKQSLGKYVFIEVKPNTVVAMANTHLPDEPYGPDLVKKGVSAAAVEMNERKVRISTASPIIRTLAQLAQRKIPVFLTGDFNSPSHLDWTQATIHRAPNHRYVVAWTVSVVAQHHGLIDSFRYIHPDPLKNPGMTWPASRPKANHSYDGFNPSANDVPDRIDFIYTGGPSRVIDSRIIGEKGKNGVNMAINPWPSDHRAVISRFLVTPTVLSKEHLIRLTAVHSKITRLPFIKTATNSIKSGEPITIRWGNAPGNRYDYVAIAPLTRSFKPEEAIRLYTKSAEYGSVQLNAHSIHGNWPAWYRSSKLHWPLTPGIYEIKLMLDDSPIALATMQVEVTI